MGVVVAATHVTLDQKVALKFLLPEAVVNPEALARFLREARNAVRLKSEHVARIIDVGTLDNGAPYIVMEYLAGEDLGGWLQRERSLSASVAVDFVLQACDAIAEAHSLGIVHRDLKPQNLFVTHGHDGANLVKVLDFGISKSMAGGDAVSTATHTVMGSPAYMSPEQMRSAKLVDNRTDIWALGVILYQLLVGRTPWDGESFTDMALKVTMEPMPPFPGSVGRPRGFDAVVQRCLEKDPARRYPSVAALAAALAPFAPPHAQPLVERIARIGRGDPATGDFPPVPQLAGGAPASAAPARPELPGTLAALPSTTIGGAAGENLNAPKRARKGALVAIVGAAVVIGGIAIVAVTAGGGTAPASTTPAAAPAQAPVPPAASPPTPATASPTPPVAAPPQAAVVVDAGSATATTAAPRTPSAPGENVPSAVAGGTSPPATPAGTQAPTADATPRAQGSGATAPVPHTPKPASHPPSHAQGSARPPGGNLPNF
jgi:serine/threonine-protein kinase